VRIAEAGAVSASEAKTLFSCLQTFPALVLAVSGGPDSTALMLLAARWRDSLDTKPKLVAVTVDHGLRKEARRRRRRAPRATVCSGTPRARRERLTLSRRTRSTIRPKQC
jgi:tRNA(Ile)-lysidine synthase